MHEPSIKPRNNSILNTEWTFIYRFSFVLFYLAIWPKNCKYWTIFMSIKDDIIIKVITRAIKGLKIIDCLAVFWLNYSFEFINISLFTFVLWRFSYDVCFMCMLWTDKRTFKGLHVLELTQLMHTLILAQRKCYTYIPTPIFNAMS